MTPKQDHMILHASGLSQHDHQFRVHYCDRRDNLDLLQLVTTGMMTGPHLASFLNNQNAYFYLTEAGIAHAWKLKREMK